MQVRLIDVTLKAPLIISGKGAVEIRRCHVDLSATHGPRK